MAMSSFDPVLEYSRGFVGCRYDPRAVELFCDGVLRAGGNPDGDSVSKRWGLEGTGKGKLTATWLHVDSVWPGCWPGPPQLVGDCTVHGGANAILTSMACEILDGKPDSVTGIIEGAPELTPKAVANIPIACESLWAWRGRDSDGWTCADVAATATTKGFLLRKPYPELKCDLTEYTETTIRLGGSRPPSKAWLEESSQHKARTATMIKGREMVRDFLASGYGIFNCSGLGFSSTRSEFGVARQTGSWSHSQAWIGYDDRESTVAKYGQALVCWLNSWGRFNDGGNVVEGTNLTIPDGAYWALASTIDRCTAISLSSVAGWPRRKLPSYGAEGNL